MSSEDAGAAPAASKRKRVEDVVDGSNGTPRKKTRTRVSYSCSECHRRKQKCDRQQPCGHCIARKVPELCKGYTPGKNDTSDLTQRLARLERIIELALPGYSGSASPPEHDSPRLNARDVDMSRGSSPDDEGKPLIPTGGALVNGGEYYGNSALGSLTYAPIFEQLHAKTIPGAIEEVSPSEKLESLVHECGVPPHKLPDLLEELPPQQLCNTLIDYYFTAVNYTRYPIDEAGFRRAFDTITRTGLRIQAEDVRFLPLLFVVLAIAARLAPDHLLGNEHHRRITSLRYYWSSRRSLLIAAAIQTDSLELVLARLLSARFLVFDRRVTECWSQLGAAVRTAQALGLHRDGAMLGLDHQQTEDRRRIWSYLYHADRTQALILGRPSAIQDEYTSTLTPVNLDESVPGTPRPLPLTTPTPWTFITLRHQLAVIIGHIVHHFQQVRNHHNYNSVIALDEELQQFVALLPPHFAQDDPDTSLDASQPYIPVHRFIIITEVFFVRISLHRPYLLRRLSSDRYSLSRRASFDSAKRDYRTRQAFKQSASSSVEVLRALGGAYREFQAAMIAGIALMIDNSGPEASEMHEILDGFMRDHEGMQDMDPTTKRELKIIEFFKRKAAARSEDGIGIGTGGDASTGYTGSMSALKGAQARTNSLVGMMQQFRRVSGSHPTQSTAKRTATFRNLALQQPVYQGTPTPTPSSPDQGFHSPQQGRAGGSVGSGFTPPDEAQQLLDVWCNSVINSGGMAPDAPAPTPDAQGQGWAAATATPGMAGFAIAFPPIESMGDSTGVGASAGAAPTYEADWNYWENLVSAINRNGAPA